MQKYFAAIFLLFNAAFFVILVSMTIALPLVPAALISLNVGLGAILIRESITRWNKGFRSLLLLGAAYAMILEGIGFQSFFNPQSGAGDAGLLGFDRWGGINLVWALGITMMHVVFNIAVPITFTDALFPKTAGQIGIKTLVIIFFAFLVDTSVVLLVPNYHPTRGALAVIIMLIFLLITAAKLLPAPLTSKTASLPSDFALFICGIIGAVVFIVTFIGFHTILPNPLLNVFALLVLLAIYGWLLLELPDLPQHSKVALAAGIYCVPTALAVLSKNLIMAIIAVTVMLTAWNKSKRAGTETPGPAAGL